MSAECPICGKAANKNSVRRVSFCRWHTKFARMVAKLEEERSRSKFYPYPKGPAMGEEFVGLVKAVLRGIDDEIFHFGIKRLTRW